MVILLVVILLAAIANVVAGQFDFGSYDCSALTDSTWRWFSGEKPYRDYYCTWPPLTYLIGSLAFQAFGVKWYSLTLAASLLFAVLSGLGVWTIHSSRKAGLTNIEPLLAWVYVCAQFVPFFFITHLWHGAMSYMLALYAFLTCYFVHAEFDQAAKIRPALLAGLCVALALLPLTKPNIGWLAAAIVMGVSAVAARPVLKAIGATCLGSLVLLGGSLAICHLNPVDIVTSYLSISEREMYFFVGFDILIDNTWARLTVLTYAISLLYLLAAVKGNRANFVPPFKTRTLLAYGAVLVSVAGFGTNWDLKINDLGPLMLGFGLLALDPPLAHHSLARRLVTGTTCFVFLLVGYCGVMRIKMQCGGPWAGPSWGPFRKIDDSFFGDFYARAQMVDILKEADAAEELFKGKKLFFGPRLEFEYARYGLPSPTKMPIWWHPGTSYPASAFNQIEQDFKDSRFDALIFWRYKDQPDFTRMPKAVTKYIREKYASTGTYKYIYVLVPK